MGKQKANIPVVQPKTQKAVKKAVLSACPKLTPKQEKFCKYLASGENATQAAIKAGYSKKTAKQMAHENLTKPYLSKIVSENAKEAQAKFEYGVEKHAAELEEAKDFAKKLGNPAAFLSAIIQKGKLLGLYVEKVEATVKAPIIVDDIEDIDGE